MHNALLKSIHGAPVFFITTLLLGVSLPVQSEVVFSNDATVSKAANGVPLVNIARPNAKGLSHNQFTQFNVEQKGLILNNSTQPVNTQLGGYVPGNAQLTTRSATVILNEVVSANPSVLQGYMEVAGTKAAVVVANPWGLSCDGCGFINTSSAALATGKPVIQPDGQLSGFTVGQGRLSLEGSGLNASNTERLSFFTRALIVNAELHANDLGIVTGNNELGLDGTAKGVSDQGEKPEFAIDSSAIGGMYANTIRLIGTEAGVGMRLAAPVAAMTGNVTISANGDVRLAKASANKNVSINAERLTLKENVTAGGDVSVEVASPLLLEKRLDAGGNIQIVSPTVHVADTAVIAAQKATAIQGDGLLNQGLIFAKEGIQFSLGEWLENGIAASENDALLYKRAAIFSEGNITIQGASSGRVKRFSNYGSLLESIYGDLNIKADILDNVNIGWKLASPHDDNPEVTYSPSQYLFDTYYGVGISSTSGLEAYRYTATTTVNDIASYGRAGFLLGQNIRIEADVLTNDHGIVSSSGGLDLGVNTLINTGTTVHDEKNTETTVRWHTCKRHTNRNTTCGNAESQLAKNEATGGLPLLLNQKIIPSVIEGMTSVQLTVEGKLKNGSDIEATLQNTGTSFSPDSLNVGVNLSGLFHHAAPDHPYQIETDPAINTYRGFLGSAYLLEHLNWSPSVTQKRLGDGFYEITLIREFLLASTGSRFISPDIADEKEQFEYLMQNAIAATDSLHLSPGIALTREQINALEQDMVWLESRFIGGEEVLVPVVYLAQGRSRLLQDGAIIGGGNVTIDAGYIENNGLFSASQDLAITTASDFANQGGRLKAEGDLTLASGGDIVNESGSMEGNNVSLSAMGDIMHSTASIELKNSHAANDMSSEVWGTRTGDSASVIAKNRHTETANGNLWIQGAQISGNNIALNAGNNLIVATVEKRTGSQLKMNGLNHLEEEIYHLQSRIEAANNLSMQAGADFVAIAAQIGAKENLSINANGRVDILATEENRTEESRVNGTRQQHVVIDNVKQQLGSYLVAGNNLDIQAGGDVAIYASSLEAGGAGSIDAGGNILFQAGIDESYHSEEHRKKGSVRQTVNKQGYLNQSVASSVFTAENDVTLNAGKNISLYGSAVVAGDTLHVGEAALDVSQLNAGTQGTIPENLVIGGVTVKNESWNETQRTLRGPVADIAKAVSFMAISYVPTLSAGLVKESTLVVDQHESHRKVSQEQAGNVLLANDIDIKVANTAKITASMLGANNKITVAAKDIIIDAAKETFNEAHSSSQESMKSLGMKLQKDEFRVAGVEKKKVSESDSVETVAWKGSSLKADQLVLNAANDIVIKGATVDIDGDAVISAGNQLTIGGYESTVEQQHKESTETTTVALGVRNAYVDAALSVKAMAEATEAVKQSRKALDEAESRASKGELAEEDVKYFRINLAMVTANLVQMEIAMAASLAAGAASAGTGFYVSGSAVHEKSETESTSNNGQWTGSVLQIGGDATLKADKKIVMQGSGVAVAKTLTVDAEKIELLSAQENGSSVTQSKSSREGISLSTQSAGGGGINIGAQKDKSESHSQTQRNSHLTAGTIASNSDSLHLAGAQIEADHVAIKTGSLIIDSVQDTYEAKQRSTGGSIGISGGTGGVTGASASANFQKTDSSKKWVTEQNGIIGHDGIQVVADETTLNGGIIANAIRDDDGKWIDKGGLQLVTDKLTINHIYDEEKTKTVGANLAVGINLGGENTPNGTQSNAPAGNTSTEAAATAQKKGVPLNSVTAGGVYQGHITEQTTYATLGQGNIVVGGVTLTENNAESLGLATLNRDVGNAQEITRDQDIGGLNASMTVDGRWFSEEGRAEMLQQQKDMGKNAKAVVAGASQDILRATGTYSTYEVMFTEDAKMYVLEYTDDGHVKRNEDGIPLRREVSDEEKKKLVRSSDGKIYIANNGIFNDQDGAAKYAEQHGVDHNNGKSVVRTQYFIEFQKTNNFISELLVAGYQKFIEGDFWGLTNLTALTKDMIYFYGGEGLHLDGHSRGSMTVGNAMGSVVNDPFAVGAMPGLSVNFFGPAFNVYKGDQLLSILQNRSAYPEEMHSDMSLHFQNHNYDPVGRLFFVGNNPGSGGVIPHDSSPFREELNALLGKPNTTHNCYGFPFGSNSCGNLWGVQPMLMPTVPAGR